MPTPQKQSGGGPTYTTLYDAGCNATVNERASAGRPPYSEYCGYHPEAGFVTRFDYVQGRAWPPP